MEEQNTELEQTTEETLMETGEQEPKEPKKKGFKFGLVIGILSTLVVLGGTLCVGLFAGVVHFGAVDSSLLTDTVTSKISAIKGLISLYYYEDVDDETLADGLYAGLVDALDDPYSVYYTADEYADMMKTTTQQYYGIGIGLTKDSDTGYINVVTVYEGTPSEEAGILEGDIITAVDGESVTDLELDDVVDLILGEDGTDVVLTIVREDETLEISVTRREINIPSVDYEMLEGNIGYIQISRFATDTANEFEAAVADLQEQGMTSMIIDLRYNPGGLLSSVVQIADDILPEGVIVYTEDKYGNREEQVSSGETSLSLPIAVLINEGSASASEILAGAIRDYEYGTLIGTTTYGKGVVQKTYELTDGSAVKLTTETYYTPNGENIHGTGISPDIELEYEFLGTEEDTYSYSLDNQIQKAIEVLSEE